MNSRGGEDTEYQAVMNAILDLLNFQAPPVLACKLAWRGCWKQFHPNVRLLTQKVIGLCYDIELFYSHPNKVLTLLARTKQFNRLRHRELLPFIYLNYFAFNFNAQLTSFRI